jgi:hypothetical protein
MIIVPVAVAGLSAYAAAQSTEAQKIEEWLKGFDAALVGS